MWILTGSEPLEIHSCFSFHMLFIVDLQCITTRKVKSGCALNPKLRSQSRESEPNSHESVALSRATFQYNGSTGYPVCLTLRESEPNSHESVHFPRATFQYNAHICHSICLIRPESEPYPNKFAALSPMIRTLQSTTGNLHRENAGKLWGRRPRHEDGRSMQGRVTQST